MAERIQSVLDDRDTELKWSAEYPFLRKRVTVLLDGKDVTRLCAAFNVPTGRVVLFEERDGKKVIQIRCGCGITTNRERVAAARRRGECGCPDCGERFEWSVSQDVFYGRVAVVPA